MGLTRACDAFLSNRKRSPRLIPACLLIAKSIPRKRRNVPTEADPNNYTTQIPIRHHTQNPRMKLTIPARWVLCHTIARPPNSPRRAIKIQLTGNNPVPENKSPSFMIMMRIPTASPPETPSVAIPATRPISNTPSTKPRKKKPSTMAESTASGTPVSFTELINAAHAGW